MGVWCFIGAQIHENLGKYRQDTHSHITVTTSHIIQFIFTHFETLLHLYSCLHFIVKQKHKYFLYILILCVLFKECERKQVNDLSNVSK